MIDVSRNLFEEYSGTYLNHLKAGEEIQIDLEQGKTLSITGESVDPKEIGSDTCNIVTSMEQFRADGKRYYQDLANGDVIGIILNNDQGLLLSPQILEEKQEKPYQISFEEGREFSLSKEELDRALELIEIAGMDRPNLASIHENMKQQAEAGQEITLSLEDGEQLMQVWQEEDQIYRLLGSCPNDLDFHIMDEFQNYDGKKEQMFANIMNRLQKEQPDLSLTEEDLHFGDQMTLDEFGLG